MRKIWLLSKTMIKTTSLDLGQTFSTSYKKKNGSFLQYILVIFLALYLAGIVFVGSYYIINQFSKSGMENLLIELFFVLLSIILVITSFTIIPSIFFFDKDLERFMILPITMSEFIISKMIQMIYVTYKFMAIFVLPFFITYVLLLKPSFFFSFNLGISILTYPVLPISLLFLFLTFLFSFMPLFKNRNLFTYIAMIGSVVLGISINVFVQKTLSTGTSIDQFIINVLGNPVIATPINIIFPSLHFFVRGINENSILIIFLSSLLNILFSYFLVMITQKFYLNIIQSAQVHSGKRKKIDYNKNKGLFKQRNTIKTFMIYDIKSILNSPIMAINYLFPIFIIPGILLFQFIVLKRNDSVSLEINILLIKNLINSLTLLERIFAIAFVGFMSGLLVSSLSTMTNTSISREGIHMQKFKSLPLNLMDVVRAKISLTVILTLIPFLLIIISLGIYLSFNILDLLLLSILSIIGSFCSQILSITLELIKPKLNWTNETQAVKQNFLSIIPMFTAIAFTAFLFYAFINFNYTIIIVITPVSIILISFFVFRSFPYLIEKYLLPSIEHNF